MSQNKSVNSRRPTQKKVKIDYFWKKISLGFFVFFLILSGTLLFLSINDSLVQKSNSNNEFFVASDGDSVPVETVPTVPDSYSESELVVDKKPTKLKLDWATGEDTTQYQISISTATDTEETRHAVRARSAVANQRKVEGEMIDYRYYDETDSEGLVSSRVEVILKNLNPTTRYEFVISERPSPEDEYSEIDRGEAFTTPRAPKNLQMNTGTTDNRFFELSWEVSDEASQDIIGYNVYFREEQDEEFASATDSNDFSTWTRLSFTETLARMRRFFEVGKRYEFIVRSIGPDGSESPIREKASFWSGLPEMKILIVDEGQHAASVRRVLHGDYRPIALTEHDSQDENRAVANSQEEIYLGRTSTTQNIIDGNNDWTVGTALDETYDVVNLSFSTYNYAAARNFYRALKARYGSRETKPIFVVSAGNEKTTCTDEAYEHAKINGSLPSDENYYRNLSAAEQQAAHYRACNLIPAYIAREHPEFMENVIVVGGNVNDPEISSPGTQHPGSVLEDHWISTYYGFSQQGNHQQNPFSLSPRSRIYGTSFSAPYVARAIANIKRRLPFLSNAQILNIVYETALPKADREVWGRGVFSPGNIERRVSEIQEEVRS